MNKNNKSNFIFLFFYFIIILFVSEVHANEQKKFLSLRNTEVNLRQGPSFDYPVKLIYKKKFLPVVVLDKSETWRKIKDFENNSGWIHVSQLSKKKSAINIKNHSVLYKNSSIYSKPIARLEVGRLVLIIRCKAQWCKIKTGNYKGWISKKNLWGKI